MARLQYHLQAKSLGRSTTVDVLLPDCPFGMRPEDYYRKDLQLPVLFMLHGGGGNSAEWPRLTRIETMIEDRNLCVVCPSIHEADYTNMYYGQDWFNWLTNDLYDYIHATLPVSDKREDNYVAGQSIGGYGAAQCALRCPEKFSHVGLLSSGVGIIDHILQGSGVPDGGPSGLKILCSFGPAESLQGSINDTFSLVSKTARSGKPLPRVFSVCGTEDHCYPGNVKLRNLMREYGYDITWVEGPGGHTWDFWDIHTPAFLEWLPR